MINSQNEIHPQTKKLLNLSRLHMKSSKTIGKNDAIIEEVTKENFFSQEHVDDNASALISD